MPDLLELLNKLASESTKARAKDSRQRARAKLELVKSEPTEKELRLNRLTSSRWKDESLVMIVSDGHCACGRTYEYPHQRLFIKRYHPTYGIHFEALGHKPLVCSLPFRIERDYHRLQACPACMTQADADMLSRQMFLPLDGGYANVEET